MASLPEDIMHDLKYFQQYAAKLKNLLNKAEEHAPEQATGTDSSGAIHVQLDASGLPHAIRAESNWNTKINPAELGNTVTEAFNAALSARLESWTHSLRESGWQNEFELIRSSGIPAGGTAEGAIPDAFRREPKNVEPRPLSAMTEDMMSALDRAGESSEQPAEVQGSGSAANGRLVMTLSKTGGLTCTADARWASEQSGAMLTTALGDALRIAKESLAEATGNENRTSSGTGLDDIFDEAIALLGNPQRLAGS